MTPFGEKLRQLRAERGVLQQDMAAALNHSAFNAANALGPWLAGMAIAAGFGWQSAGWVGCALSLGGLVIWGLSALEDRRTANVTA